MNQNHFFVYRVTDPAELDTRCPIGGVVVIGFEPVAVMRDAWVKARTRYVCKPNQVLILHKVNDDTDKRHAELMQGDWERAFAKFQELMEVS